LLLTSETLLIPHFHHCDALGLIQAVLCALPRNAHRITAHTFEAAEAKAFISVKSNFVHFSQVRFALDYDAVLMRFALCVFLCFSEIYAATCETAFSAEEAVSPDAGSIFCASAVKECLHLFAHCRR
jgi:hypothetical protein